MRPIDLVSACHGFGSHLDDRGWGGGGGYSISKGRGCLSSRLGLSISDFGLTWGVLGKTPLYLAINVSFRVARGETLKNYSFSICFISSIHVIRILNGLF